MSNDTGKKVTTEAELAGPVIFPPEAYISEEYARAERDKLWRKVWQVAGRVEDLQKVGDFITYEILDDTVLIVRTAPDAIKAYHNVCPHRGRRLVDTPAGERNAHGYAKQFVCNFHGWQFDLEGKNTGAAFKEDWQGTLTDERIGLPKVNCDTWGGWIFINLDPNCKESLREYLEPAASMLDPFQTQNMRYKWRRWGTFDCNWKVALEAFNETYHVPQTHPEFTAFGDYRGWSKGQGKHSNIGYDTSDDMKEAASKMRLGSGDPRTSTAEMQSYINQNVNAVTTQTLVDAANRLATELPEGTPGDQVLKHWLASAKRDDAARGVIWPEVDPDHMAKSGTAWQIFPNFQVGQAVSHALCYSARPLSYDPNWCIFEVSAFELYPEGKEPKTEWIFTTKEDKGWGTVLPQDFGNMAAVQQGMKSLSFKGSITNPKTERAVSNLHHNLSLYMNAGELHTIKK